MVSDLQRLQEFVPDLYSCCFGVVQDTRENVAFSLSGMHEFQKRMEGGFMKVR